MMKITLAGALATLLLLQPSLLLAAEKDAGSFFHRTRKAQAEKKAPEPAEAVPAAVIPAVDEKILDEKDADGLPVPPATPDNPNKGYLVGKIPSEPEMGVPQPPRPIPAPPKGAPQAPSIPKTK